jgi:predicted DNA-binding transcriptional regulator YafY
MPKNKLASFRYRVINNCLRNTGRKWTVKDLIDEVSKKLYEEFGQDKGISLRTLRYDIQLMRSLPPRGFDAPIVNKDGYYEYKDPDFSIDDTPLNETDIDTINEAIELLSQFSKLPIYEELALVKAKLYGEVIQSSERTKVIDFEQRQVKGIEYLAPLYKTITEKRALNMAYQPFKAEKPFIGVVHPYLLKQYNHRWYLIGLSQSHNNIGLYSLDRILSFDYSPDTYIPNAFMDANTYFKNIIGITVPTNEEIQTITLHFTNDQKPYVLTKPLHASQQILSDDTNGLIITVEVIPNYEFFSLVLSYGDKVEVIAPINIREIVRCKIVSACNKYN